MHTENPWGYEWFMLGQENQQATKNLLIWVLERTLLFKNKVKQQKQGFLRQNKVFV